MEQLINEINELERQIATLDAQIGQAMDEPQRRVIIDQQNLVRNRLSEKQEELRILQESQQQTEQRAQLQDEHTGGLKEAIRQIFEAVIPADQFEQIVGPSEFSVIQQTFNQLVEEAVNENNAALYASIGNQIEAKDEKIRELTTKAISLEAEAQNAQRIIDQLRESNQIVEAKLDQIESLLDEVEEKARNREEELAAKQREIESLKAVIENKDAEIARLHEELRKAPEANGVAPEATYKPSASLQDKIADSQNRIKTALEIALEGRQFRGRISAGDHTFPEPPAIQYDADTSAIVVENNRIHTPEVAAPVEDTFPNTASELGDNEGVARSDVGTVPQEATLEERVARLEAAVFGWQAVA